MTTSTAASPTRSHQAMRKPRQRRAANCSPPSNASRRRVNGRDGGQSTAPPAPSAAWPHRRRSRTVGLVKTSCCRRRVVGLGCETAAGFTASGNACSRADFAKNATPACCARASDHRRAEQPALSCLCDQSTRDPPAPRSLYRFGRAARVSRASLRPGRGAGRAASQRRRRTPLRPAASRRARTNPGAGGPRTRCAPVARVPRSAPVCPEPGAGRSG